MKRASLFVWLLVPAFLALTTATAFARAQKPEPAKQPAVAPATSVAPANVKPVKGLAVINVLKPVVKVQGTEVVTLIKVKNLSYGSIAGLKLDEYLVRQGGERGHRRQQADDQADHAQRDSHDRTAHAEESQDGSQQLPVLARERQGAGRDGPEVPVAFVIRRPPERPCHAEYRRERGTSSRQCHTAKPAVPGRLHHDPNHLPSTLSLVHHGTNPFCRARSGIGASRLALATLTGGHPFTRACSRHR